jgi:hypothetical protein
MEHIKRELTAQGLNASAVEQRDSYGWYIETSQDGVIVWSMLQYSGPWLLINEARHSLLKRLLGKAPPQPLATVCGRSSRDSLESA